MSYVYYSSGYSMPQTSNNQSHYQPHYLVSIPLYEYEILQRCRQENYALHERLFHLTASNQTLQDTLKNREEIILARDKTIEELKRENEELKARISHLEASNNELNDKNTILSSKIENLENELTNTKEKLNTTTQELAITKTELATTKEELAITKAELSTTKEELGITKAELATTKEELGITKAELAITKEELKTVRTELDTIKSNKLLMKFIMGLQDLNAWEKLEKKVANPNILLRLRRNRVGECHYIDNDYELIEKEIRRNILIDKLNGSDDIKKMLDTMYPELLDTLTPYLAKREIQITLDDDNTNTISDGDIEDMTQWANKWWDF